MAKESKWLQRNSRMKQRAVGEEAKIGKQLLVEEAESKVFRKGVYNFLGHDQLTGPWTAMSVPIPKISLKVTMKGRKVGLCHLRVYRSFMLGLRT